MNRQELTTISCLFVSNEHSFSRMNVISTIYKMIEILLFCLDADEDI
jgi:hypothetical protein